MSSRATLVVVIVRDAVLRAALAAHLAQTGVTLLTAGALRAVPEPRSGEGAVLVLEEAAMSRDDGEWIETLRHEQRWRHVVLLTLDGNIAENRDDWLIHVNRDAAADTLLRLISGWRISETGE